MPGPKESQKMNASTISKKSFFSQSTVLESKNGNGNGNGNDLMKKYQVTKKGVSSPLLIELLLQYLQSSTIMLQINERAVVNSLLSINLIQLLSVITQWEFISVYKIKTVYSALNLFLQKIRDCITNLRNKSLISSFYGNSNHLNLDNENEILTNIININDNVQVMDHIIDSNSQLIKSENVLKEDENKNYVTDSSSSTTAVKLIKKNTILNHVESYDMTAIIDCVVESKNYNEDNNEIENENEN